MNAYLTALGAGSGVYGRRPGVDEDVPCWDCDQPLWSHTGGDCPLVCSYCGCRIDGQPTFDGVQVAWLRDKAEPFCDQDCLDNESGRRGVAS